MDLGLWAGVKLIGESVLRLALAYGLAKFSLGSMVYTDSEFMILLAGSWACDDGFDELL